MNNMRLDEAKKACAYSPKGHLSYREKADLNTATWQLVDNIPTLFGQKFKATAKRNEKLNITFKVVKK